MGPHNTCTQNVHGRKVGLMVWDSCHIWRHLNETIVWGPVPSTGMRAPLWNILRYMTFIDSGRKTSPGGLGTMPVYTRATGRGLSQTLKKPTKHFLVGLFHLLFWNSVHIYTYRLQLAKSDSEDLKLTGTSLHLAASIRIFCNCRWGKTTPQD